MRVGTVLTVSVNFDAKRQENQNLILAIVPCRNFVFEGNSTLVLFTRGKKNQIYCFFSKIMCTGNQYISIPTLKRNSYAEFF